MSKKIEPVRGVNDIYGEAVPYWDRLEQAAQQLLGAYGYQQIRLPMFERTELFRRSIGEGTDVVQKEMFTFETRGGTSITLRPEATASCVRAAISNGLLHNQRQRLWCQGPMFRYERPQKGRYRQFHQINVEAFGFPGPDIDAELILLSARLWRALGLEGLTLRLNSLGTPASRATYRAHLTSYLRDHENALDDDSVRRLELNPLRILDSKNPDMAALIAAAPAITDHLDPESDEHFTQLRAMLDANGIGYTIDPRLVRGLDYYTRTVFEWETDQLGAQAAVCSGGRYDGLVEQLGGRATPGVGWALGVERLVELMRASGRPVVAEPPHLYLAMVGAAATAAGLKLAEWLRDTHPSLRIWAHCGGGSFKAQLKAADRSGAAAAVILGDAEVAAGRAALKPLRTDEEQQSLTWDELGQRVTEFLN